MLARSKNSVSGRSSGWDWRPRPCLWLPGCHCSYLAPSRKRPSFGPVTIIHSPSPPTRAPLQQPPPSCIWEVNNPLLLASRAPFLLAAQLSECPSVKLQVTAVVKAQASHQGKVPRYHGKCQVQAQALALTGLPET